MDAKTIKEYEEAGCPVAGGPELFAGLHITTNGDVCETGCAHKDQCLAYKKLTVHPRKPKPDASRVTNAKFSKSESFIKLCENAGIMPTKRQASKFRDKRGKLYKLMYVLEVK